MFVVEFGFENMEIIKGLGAPPPEVGFLEALAEAVIAAGDNGVEKNEAGQVALKSFEVLTKTRKKGKEV